MNRVCGLYLRAEMCTDMWIDMCTDMWINMCTDMCTYIWMDMCTDMWIVNRHVDSHVDSHVLMPVAWTRRAELRWQCAECSRMFRNVPECSGMFQNVPECSRMFRSVPECSRMFRNVPECSRTPLGMRHRQVETVGRKKVSEASIRRALHMPSAMPMPGPETRQHMPSKLETRCCSTS